ncbi:hypothetical protein [Blastococcus tunisiensis]|uniref:Uncharacterized protein n=1 Tax=Blastococcus tunisiensis TaxID=1798228 RepID=A0A1I1VPG6_9ACTN|nr:hypothetical protein [Blastococcus sp. DSM 46838]SFD84841.1 hypothetical protein SAMN05216574_10149 [Blastococcus sp. DSM 46838]
MIISAGLLVLVGLGLFVGGILTGTTAFYWGCVAVCVIAAVLLFLAWRSISAASRGATTQGSPAASAAAPAASAGPAAPVEPPPGGADAGGPAVATGATAAAAPVEESGEPAVEEVEVTDLLLVVDLTDEVLVVDEHPRYHLPGCRHLAGRETIPVPIDEARTDGFTPCADCAPDRNLAQRARERRAAPGN